MSYILIEPSMIRRSLCEVGLLDFCICSDKEAASSEEEEEAFLGLRLLHSGKQGTGTTGQHEIL